MRQRAWSPRVALVVGVLGPGCETTQAPSPVATPQGATGARSVPERQEQARSESQIRADEQVLWFPSYGYFARAAWHFELHGFVFEPASDSIRRKVVAKALTEALQRYVGGSVDKLETQARFSRFFVDSESDKPLSAWVASRPFFVGRTNGAGHAQRWLSAVLPAADCPPGGGDLHGLALLPPDDDRRFELKVELIGERGLTFISDVDDTLKISEVRDPKALARNTLSRPWQAVPAMAGKLRAYRQQGARLHYLSSMPWQLYPQWARFRQAAGLPPGSVHLRDLSLTSLAKFANAEASAEHKLYYLRQILAHFPHRRFILLGDSGERDPEIYAEIAIAHPGQVQGIWIRSLTGEDFKASRYQALRQVAGQVSWIVFGDAAQLPDSL